MAKFLILFCIPMMSMPAMAQNCEGTNSLRIDLEKSQLKSAVAAARSIASEVAEDEGPQKLHQYDYRSKLADKAFDDPYLDRVKSANGRLRLGNDNASEICSYTYITIKNMNFIKTAASCLFNIRNYKGGVKDIDVIADSDWYNGVFSLEFGIHNGEAEFVHTGQEILKNLVYISPPYEGDDKNTFPYQVKSRRKMRVDPTKDIALIQVKGELLKMLEAKKVVPIPVATRDEENMEKNMYDEEKLDKIMIEYDGKKYPKPKISIVSAPHALLNNGTQVNSLLSAFGLYETGFFRKKVLMMGKMISGRKVAERGDIGGDFTGLIDGVPYSFGTISGYEEDTLNSVIYLNIFWEREFREKVAKEDGALSNPWQESLKRKGATKVATTP